jgi:hypothetical protein
VNLNKLDGTFWTYRIGILCIFIPARQMSIKTPGSSGVHNGKYIGEFQIGGDIQA